MTKFLLLILFLFALSNSYGQYPEQPEKKLLKEYSLYTHKFEPKSCWKYVYKLKNGLVIRQENYCNKKLTYRAEFDYDEFDNIERETETYNINDGEVNNVLEIKLEYKNKLLVSKDFGFGLIEKYFDFNELDKPKRIERIEESNLKMWPHKELIEYDDNGNIIKTINFSTYEDFNEKIINEKATIYYKYDKLNNVIEIHREYEPKRVFPIPMIGGPFLFEYEYFRYNYNKNDLWTKKFKTTNGKEYLVTKRTYK